VNRRIYIYLVKRLISYIVVVFAAISIAFFLFRLVPGDPIKSYLYQMQTLQGFHLEEQTTQQIIQYYIEKFSLNRDPFTQYISFLRELILHHNLGPSFLAFPKPAQELIMEKLPWTIGLLSISTLMSWIIGNFLGALIGWKRDTKIDRTIFILALGFSQIPFYILGVVFILVFCLMLRIFPLGGAFSPNVSPEQIWNYIISIISHATLPSITLMFASFWGWVISMRSLTINVLGEDYLLFAEAKGLKKIRLFTRYVFRNALLPQVTGLGLSMGFIMSGSVIVETLFMYPGIGTLFSMALGRLDYNVLMGCIILMVFSVATSVLIIDLLLPFVDPRVRGD